MDTPDVAIVNSGSLILFVPQNDDAEAWLQEHTDGQWVGPHTLCVEPRYAENLAQGLGEAGFTVSR